MKKDIFVLITPENSENLYEILEFITHWEYSKEEMISPEEYGKISTKNFNFRFMPFRHSLLEELRENDL